MLVQLAFFLIFNIALANGLIITYPKGELDFKWNVEFRCDPTVDTYTFKTIDINKLGIIFVIATKHGIF